MSTILRDVSVDSESGSDDDIPATHSQQQQNTSASASHQAAGRMLLYVRPNSPEIASISTMSMHASHAIIHRYVVGDESRASVKSFLYKPVGSMLAGIALVDMTSSLKWI